MSSAANSPSAEATGDQPERRFGWANVFVPQDEDPREVGGKAEGEAAVLARFLRDQRLTLELKCSGLDAPALARRSVAPSNLSLLGLVRHLAGVEQHWFRSVLAREDAPAHYWSDDDPDGEFDGAVADPEMVAEAWRTWRAEVAFAERFVAQAPSLDISGSYDFGEVGRGTITLREVLVHMIEEYARHNGHADFLRERIDGRIGQ